MFEEKDGCSDRTSVVKSSVKKSSFNPNATEWPVRKSGEVKEIPAAQDKGAKVEVKGQDAPVQGTVAHVRPNSLLGDEPRLLQMINMTQLPKAELMTFNGYPLEFWVFMRSFDNSIESVAIGDGAKLNRLFQYCKGEALKVIKYCAVMRPSEGYAKARVLLKERFGNGYQIFEMWVKKVTEGTIVRHGEERHLQEMTDDLRSCKETLEEIHTRRNMVRIAERLPQFLQGRCRKLVVKTLETSGRYPSITSLMRFVSETAHETTEPVFGVSENKPKDFSGRGLLKSERDKGASFGV